MPVCQCASVPVCQFLLFTSSIFLGGAGGHVHSQQGDGAGKDFNLEILSSIRIQFTTQVKYIGHADFAAGIWIGLELRNPKGKQMAHKSKHH